MNESLGNLTGVSRGRVRILNSLPEHCPAHLSQDGIQTTFENIMTEKTPENAKLLAVHLWNYINHRDINVKKCGNFVRRAYQKFISLHLFCCQVAQLTNQYVLDRRMKEALVDYVKLELEVAYLPEYINDEVYFSNAKQRIKKLLWKIYSKYYFYAKSRRNRVQTWELIFMFLQHEFPATLPKLFDDILNDIRKTLPRVSPKFDLYYHLSPDAQPGGVEPNSSLFLTSVDRRSIEVDLTVESDDEEEESVPQHDTNRPKGLITKTNLKVNTMICLTDDSEDEEDLGYGSTLNRRPVGKPPDAVIDLTEGDELPDGDSIISRQPVPRKEVGQYGDLLGQARSLISKFQELTGTTGVTIRIKNGNLEIDTTESKSTVEAVNTTQQELQDSSVTMNNTASEENPQKSQEFEDREPAINNEDFEEIPQALQESSIKEPSMANRAFEKNAQELSEYSVNESTVDNMTSEENRQESQKSSVNEPTVGNMSSKQNLQKLQRWSEEIPQDSQECSVKESTVHNVALEGNPQESQQSSVTKSTMDNNFSEENHQESHERSVKEPTVNNFAFEENPQEARESSVKAPTFGTIAFEENLQKLQECSVQEPARGNMASEENPQEPQESSIKKPTFNNMAFEEYLQEAHEYLLKVKELTVHNVALERALEYLLKESQERSIKASTVDNVGSEEVLQESEQSSAREPTVDNKASKDISQESQKDSVKKPTVNNNMAFEENMLGSREFSVKASTFGNLIVEENLKKSHESSVNEPNVDDMAYEEIRRESQELSFKEPTKDNIASEEKPLESKQGPIAKPTFSNNMAFEENLQEAQEPSVKEPRFNNMTVAGNHQKSQECSVKDPTTDNIAPEENTQEARDSLVKEPMFDKITVEEYFQETPECSVNESTMGNMAFEENLQEAQKHLVKEPTLDNKTSANNSQASQKKSDKMPTFNNNMAFEEYAQNSRQSSNKVKTVDNKAFEENPRESQEGSVKKPTVNNMTSLKEPIIDKLLLASGEIQEESQEPSVKKHTINHICFEENPLNSQEGSVKKPTFNNKAFEKNPQEGRESSGNVPTFDNMTVEDYFQNSEEYSVKEPTMCNMASEESPQISKECSVSDPTVDDLAFEETGRKSQEPSVNEPTVGYKTSEENPQEGQEGSVTKQTVNNMVFEENTQEAHDSSVKDTTIDDMASKETRQESQEPSVSEPTIDYMATEDIPQESQKSLVKEPTINNLAFYENSPNSIDSLVKELDDVASEETQQGSQESSGKKPTLDNIVSPEELQEFREVSEGTIGNMAFTENFEEPHVCSGKEQSVCNMTLENNHQQSQEFSVKKPTFDNTTFQENVQKSQECFLKEPSLDSMLSEENRQESQKHLIILEATIVNITSEEWRQESQECSGKKPTIDTAAEETRQESQDHSVQESSINNMAFGEIPQESQGCLNNEPTVGGLTSEENQKESQNSLVKGHGVNNVVFDENSQESKKSSVTEPTVDNMVSEQSLQDSRECSVKEETGDDVSSEEKRPKSHKSPVNGATMGNTTAEESFQESQQCSVRKPSMNNIGSKQNSRESQDYSVKEPTCDNMTFEGNVQKSQECSIKKSYIDILASGEKPQESNECSDKEPIVDNISSEENRPESQEYSVKEPPFDIMTIEKILQKPQECSVKDSTAEIMASEEKIQQSNEYSVKESSFDDLTSDEGGQGSQECSVGEASEGNLPKSQECSLKETSVENIAPEENQQESQEYRIIRERTINNLTSEDSRQKLQECPVAEKPPVDNMAAEKNRQKIQEYSVKERTVDNKTFGENPQASQECSVKTATIDDKASEEIRQESQDPSVKEPTMNNKVSEEVLQKSQEFSINQTSVVKGPTVNRMAFDENSQESKESPVKEPTVDNIASEEILQEPDECSVKEHTVDDMASKETRLESLEPLVKTPAMENKTSEENHQKSQKSLVKELTVNRMVFDENPQESKEYSAKEPTVDNMASEENLQETEECSVKVPTFDNITFEENIQKSKGYSVRKGTFNILASGEKPQESNECSVKELTVNNKDSEENSRKSLEYFVKEPTLDKMVIVEILQGSQAYSVREPTVDIKASNEKQQKSHEYSVKESTINNVTSEKSHQKSQGCSVKKRTVNTHVCEKESMESPNCLVKEQSVNNISSKVNSQELQERSGKEPTIDDMVSEKEPPNCLLKRRTVDNMIINEYSHESQDTPLMRDPTVDNMASDENPQKSQECLVINGSTVNNMASEKIPRESQESPGVKAPSIDNMDYEKNPLDSQECPIVKESTVDNTASQENQYESQECSDKESTLYKMTSKEHSHEPNNIIAFKTKTRKSQKCPIKESTDTMTSKKNPQTSQESSVKDSTNIMTIEKILQKPQECSVKDSTAEIMASEEKIQQSNEFSVKVSSFDDLTSDEGGQGSQECSVGEASVYNNSSEGNLPKTQECSLKETSVENMAFEENQQESQEYRIIRERTINNLTSEYSRQELQECPIVKESTVDNTASQENQYESQECSDKESTLYKMTSKENSHEPNNIIDFKTKTRKSQKCSIKESTDTMTSKKNPQTSQESSVKDSTDIMTIEKILQKPQECSVKDSTAEIMASEEKIQQSNEYSVKESSFDDLTSDEGGQGSQECSVGEASVYNNTSEGNLPKSQECSLKETSVENMAFEENQQESQEYRIIRERTINNLTSEYSRQELQECPIVKESTVDNTASQENQYESQECSDKEPTLYKMTSKEKSHEPNNIIDFKTKTRKSQKCSIKESTDTMTFKKNPQTSQESSVKDSTDIMTIEKILQKPQECSVKDSTAEIMASEEKIQQSNEYSVKESSFDDLTSDEGGQGSQECSVGEASVYNNTSEGNLPKSQECSLKETSVENMAFEENQQESQEYRIIRERTINNLTSEYSRQELQECPIVKESTVDNTASQENQYESQECSDKESTLYKMTSKEKSHEPNNIIDFKTKTRKSQKCSIKESTDTMTFKKNPQTSQKSSVKDSTDIMTIEKILQKPQECSVKDSTAEIMASEEKIQQSNEYSVKESSFDDLTSDEGGQRSQECSVGEASVYNNTSEGNLPKSQECSLKETSVENMAFEENQQGSQEYRIIRERTINNLTSKDSRQELQECPIVKESTVDNMASQENQYESQECSDKESTLYKMTSKENSYEPNNIIHFKTKTRKSQKCSIKESTDTMTSKKNPQTSQESSVKEAIINSMGSQDNYQESQQCSVREPTSDNIASEENMQESQECSVTESAFNIKTAEEHPLESQGSSVNEPLVDNMTSGESEQELRECPLKEPTVTNRAFEENPQESQEYSIMGPIVDMTSENSGQELQELPFKEPTVINRAFEENLQECSIKEPIIDILTSEQIQQKILDCSVNEPAVANMPFEVSLQESQEYSVNESTVDIMASKENPKESHEFSLQKSISDNRASAEIHQEFQHCSNNTASKENPLECQDCLGKKSTFPHITSEENPQASEKLSGEVPFINDIISEQHSQKNSEFANSAIEVTQFADSCANMSKSFSQTLSELPSVTGVGVDENSSSQSVEFENSSTKTLKESPQNYSQDDLVKDPIINNLIAEDYSRGIVESAARIITNSNLVSDIPTNSTGSSPLEECLVKDIISNNFSGKRNLMATEELANSDTNLITQSIWLEDIPNKGLSRAPKNNIPLDEEAFLAESEEYNGEYKEIDEDILLKEMDDTNGSLGYDKNEGENPVNAIGKPKKKISAAHGNKNTNITILSNLVIKPWPIVKNKDLHMKEENTCFEYCSVGEKGSLDDVPKTAMETQSPEDPLQVPADADHSKEQDSIESSSLTQDSSGPEESDFRNLTNDDMLVYNPGYDMYTPKQILIVEEDRSRERDDPRKDIERIINNSERTTDDVLNLSSNAVGHLSDDGYILSSNQEVKTQTVEPIRNFDKPIDQSNETDVIIPNKAHKLLDWRQFYFGEGSNIPSPLNLSTSSATKYQELNESCGQKDFSGHYHCAEEIVGQDLANSEADKLIVPCDQQDFSDQPQDIEKIVTLNEVEPASQELIVPCNQKDVCNQYQGTEEIVNHKIVQPAPKELIILCTQTHFPNQYQEFDLPCNQKGFSDQYQGTEGIVTPKLVEPANVPCSYLQGSQTYPHKNPLMKFVETALKYANSDANGIAFRHACSETTDSSDSEIRLKIDETSSSEKTPAAVVPKYPNKKRKPGLRPGARRQRSRAEVNSQPPDVHSNSCFSDDDRPLADRLKREKPLGRKRRLKSDGRRTSDDTRENPKSAYTSKLRSRSQSTCEKDKPKEEIKTVVLKEKPARASKKAKEKPKSPKSAKPPVQKIRKKDSISMLPTEKSSRNIVEIAANIVAKETPCKPPPAIVPRISESSTSRISLASSPPKKRYLLEAKKNPYLEETMKRLEERQKADDTNLDQKNKDFGKQPLNNVTANQVDSVKVLNTVAQQEFSKQPTLARFDCPPIQYPIKKFNKKRPSGEHLLLDDLPLSQLRKFVRIGHANKGAAIPLSKNVSNTIIIERREELPDDQTNLHTKSHLHYTHVTAEGTECFENETVEFKGPDQVPRVAESQKEEYTCPVVPEQAEQALVAREATKSKTEVVSGARLEESDNKAHVSEDSPNMDLTGVSSEKSENEENPERSEVRCSIVSDVNLKRENIREDSEKAVAHDEYGTKTIPPCESDFQTQDMPAVCEDATNDAPKESVNMNEIIICDHTDDVNLISGTDDEPESKIVPDIPEVAYFASDYCNEVSVYSTDVADDEIISDKDTPGAYAYFIETRTDEEGISETASKSVKSYNNDDVGFKIDVMSEASESNTDDFEEVPVVDSAPKGPEVEIQSNIPMNTLPECQADTGNQITSEIRDQFSGNDIIASAHSNAVAVESDTVPSDHGDSGFFQEVFENRVLPGDEYTTTESDSSTVQSKQSGCADMDLSSELKVIPKKTLEVSTTTTNDSLLAAEGSKEGQHEVLAATITDSNSKIRPEVGASFGASNFEYNPNAITEGNGEVIPLISESQTETGVSVNTAIESISTGESEKIAHALVLDQSTSPVSETIKFDNTETQNKLISGVESQVSETASLASCSNEVTAGEYGTNIMTEGGAEITNESLTVAGMNLIAECRTDPNIEIVLEESSDVPDNAIGNVFYSSEVPVDESSTNATISLESEHALSTTQHSKFGGKGRIDLKADISPEDFGNRDDITEISLKAAGTAKTITNFTGKVTESDMNESNKHAEIERSNKSSKSSQETEKPSAPRKVYSKGSRKYFEIKEEDEQYSSQPQSHNVEVQERTRRKSAKLASFDKLSSTPSSPLKKSTNKEKLETPKERKQTEKKLDTEVKEKNEQSSSSTRRKKLEDAREEKGKLAIVKNHTRESKKSEAETNKIDNDSGPGKTSDKTENQENLKIVKDKNSNPSLKSTLIKNNSKETTKAKDDKYRNRNSKREERSSSRQNKTKDIMKDFNSSKSQRHTKEESTSEATNNVLVETKRSRDSSNTSKSDRRKKSNNESRTGERSSSRLGKSLDLPEELDRIKNNRREVCGKGESSSEASKLPSVEPRRTRDIRETQQTDVANRDQSRNKRKKPDDELRFSNGQNFSKSSKTYPQNNSKIINSEHCEGSGGKPDISRTEGDEYAKKPIEKPPLEIDENQCTNLNKVEKLRHQESAKSVEEQSSRRKPQTSKSKKESTVVEVVLDKLSSLIVDKMALRDAGVSDVTLEEKLVKFEEKLEDVPSQKISPCLSDPTAAVNGDDVGSEANPDTNMNETETILPVVIINEAEKEIHRMVADPTATRSKKRKQESAKRVEEQSSRRKPQTSKNKKESTVVEVVLDKLSSLTVDKMALGDAGVSYVTLEEKLVKFEEKLEDVSSQKISPFLSDPTAAAYGDVVGSEANPDTTMNETETILSVVINEPEKEIHRMMADPTATRSKKRKQESAKSVEEQSSRRKPQTSKNKKQSTVVEVVLDKLPSLIVDKMALGDAGVSDVTLEEKLVKFEEKLEDVPSQKISPCLSDPTPAAYGDVVGSEANPDTTMNETETILSVVINEPEKEIHRMMADPTAIRSKERKQESAKSVEEQSSRRKPQTSKNKKESTVVEVVLDKLPSLIVDKKALGDAGVSDVTLEEKLVKFEEKLEDVPSQKISPCLSDPTPAAYGDVVGSEANPDTTMNETETILSVVINEPEKEIHRMMADPTAIRSKKRKQESAKSVEEQSSRRKPQTSKNKKESTVVEVVLDKLPSLIVDKVALGDAGVSDVTLEEKLVKFEEKLEDVPSQKISPCLSDPTPAAYGDVVGSEANPDTTMNETETILSVVINEPEKEIHRMMADPTAIRSKKRKQESAKSVEEQSSRRKPQTSKNKKESTVVEVVLDKLPSLIVDKMALGDAGVSDVTLEEKLVKFEEKLEDVRSQKISPCLSGPTAAAYGDDVGSEVNPDTSMNETETILPVVINEPEKEMHRMVADPTATRSKKRKQESAKRVEEQSSRRKPQTSKNKKDSTVVEVVVLDKLSSLIVDKMALEDTGVSDVTLEEKLVKFEEKLEDVRSQNISPCLSDPTAAAYGDDVGSEANPDTSMNETETILPVGINEPEKEIHRMVADPTATRSKKRKPSEEEPDEDIIESTPPKSKRSKTYNIQNSKDSPLGKRKAVSSDIIIDPKRVCVDSSQVPSETPSNHRYTPPHLEMPVTEHSTLPEPKEVPQISAQGLPQNPTDTNNEVSDMNTTILPEYLEPPMLLDFSDFFGTTETVEASPPRSQDFLDFEVVSPTTINPFQNNQFNSIYHDNPTSCITVSPMPQQSPYPTIPVNTSQELQDFQKCDDHSYADGVETVPKCVQNGPIDAAISQTSEEPVVTNHTSRLNSMIVESGGGLTTLQYPNTTSDFGSNSDNPHFNPTYQNNPCIIVSTTPPDSIPYQTIPVNTGQGLHDTLMHSSTLQQSKKLQVSDHTPTTMDSMISGPLETDSVLDETTLDMGNANYNSFTVSLDTMLDEPLDLFSFQSGRTGYGMQYKNVSMKSLEDIIDNGAAGDSETEESPRVVEPKKSTTQAKKMKKQPVRVPVPVPSPTPTPSEMFELPTRNSRRRKMHPPPRKKDTQQTVNGDQNVRVKPMQEMLTPPTELGPKKSPRLNRSVNPPVEDNEKSGEARLRAGSTTEKSNLVAVKNKPVGSSTTSNKASSQISSPPNSLLGDPFLKESRKATKEFKQALERSQTETKVETSVDQFDLIKNEPTNRFFKGANAKKQQGGRKAKVNSPLQEPQHSSDKCDDIRWPPAGNTPKYKGTRQSAKSKNEPYKLGGVDVPYKEYAKSAVDARKGNQFEWLANYEKRMKETDRPDLISLETNFGT